MIDGKEKARTIKQLESARTELRHGIENMSVSLYTTRAKNQMNGYMDRLNEIDTALRVFGRDKVFIDDGVKPPMTREHLE